MYIEKYAAGRGRGRDSGNGLTAGVFRHAGKWEYARGC